MSNNIQADLFGQTLETSNPLIKLQDAELLYHPAFYNKSESDVLLKHFWKLSNGIRIK